MSSQHGAESQAPREGRRWNARRYIGQLAILYWIALFVSTHIPLPELPAAGAGSDKVAHVVAFGGLGLLTAFWLALGKRASIVHFLLLLAVLLVYGALDEWLQQFVGRETDFNDWIADSIGAAIGVTAIAILQLVYPLSRDESSAEERPSASVSTDQGNTNV